jgi:hypothetical protein
MPETRGRISIDAQGDVVVLSGAIDDAAGVADLLERAQAGRLVLDLAGIVAITPLGVRDWIRLLAAAARDGIQVELRRVAEPVVHQLNMLVAARGLAHVTSFFAPYACDACGREASLVIDAVANAAQLRQHQAPAMTCPACRTAMAFNDFPARYFSFLSV